MADYTAQRAGAEWWANKFHDAIGRHGGVPADYRVDSGGTQGGDYLRVVTEAIDQPTLEAIMDAANSLTVNVDPGATIEVNSQATITCDELPVNFDFVIFDERGTITEGAVTDGALVVTGDDIGSYIIEVRDAASHANGYVEIEVVEL